MLIRSDEFADTTKELRTCDEAAPEPKDWVSEEQSHMWLVR